MSYIKERQLTLDDVGGMNRPVATIPVYDHMPTIGEIITEDDYEVDGEWFTPKAIREELDEAGIIGQENAKRAAALLLWKTYTTGPQNLLVVGPSGVGKSLIWRTLAKAWDGGGERGQMIRIVNASNIVGEGWKGGTTIGQIMASWDNSFAWRRRVLVFDEWDKQYSHRGQHDYFELVEADMLSLLEHQPGTLPSNVDPSTVSIVCLGAFSKIYDAKKLKKKHSLGFGAHDTADDESDHISEQDLRDFGLSREFLARFPTIVEMDPVSLPMLQQICRVEVKKLSKELGKEVLIDDAQLDDIAEKSLVADLGARYIRTQLTRMVDAAIYEAPYSKIIDLTEGPAMLMT